MKDARAKCHSDTYAKYGDIASREIGVNGRTAGRTTQEHNWFSSTVVGEA